MADITSIDIIDIDASNFNTIDVVDIDASNFNNIDVIETEVNRGVKGERGEKGDKGDIGPPGYGLMSVTFEQNTESDTWVVNHNLNRNVIVTCYNTGGVEIFGNVINTSVNQTIIYFNIPVSGIAYIT